MAPALSRTTPPKPKLVVLGGGGHAKVAIETLRDQETYEIIGFLDGEDAPGSVIGVPKLGPDPLLAKLAGEGIAFAFPAVGGNAVRAKLGRAIVESGMRTASAVSPHAYVSATARIGAGVLIVAGAVINAETSIGDLVIVNTNAGIDHDCEIGAAAHIAPRVALAGGVKVGEGAFIGIGTSVLPRVSIGANATIGGGSCVISDIPAGAKAYGVPARIVP